MKKLFAFISLLLATTAMIFADVTVKKLDNGTAEVTFFYGNPRATEVLLAGDFNNWQNGAEAMTKTDKGFTITKIFKVTDELRYKFISDGNWTTDLKAPDFVDDGFGGKNSHVVIADMLGGDDDAAAAKAKINFVSWTMFGVQGNYLTQSVNDPAKKGLDLDSVTLGAKSYNKFVGNFLPNCPVYVEIAMSETELDGNYGAPRKIYQASKYDGADPEISVEQGLKEFFTGMLTNPVGYLSGEQANGTKGGKGYNPFLGHLKFGFNTPYINYLTGYIDAKTDVRNKVKWTTVGAWNGGYEHAGGFHVFSLGNKAVAALEEATGITFDMGFAPNRSADRKGNNYGYFGWLGLTWNDLVIDFQTNGMYGNEYAFYDPIEHDFILGVKDVFPVADGKLNFALQGLLSTSQKEIKQGMDFFGYSTDATYRSGNFDGIQNFAADAEVGYKASMFGVNLEYRMRGAQASMLYVQQNFDDGVFTLSDQLGVLNSQNIDLKAFVKPADILQIDLGVGATLPLEHIKSDSDLVAGSSLGIYGTDWGADAGSIFRSFAPLFGIEGGAEIAIKPAVTVNISDNMKLGAYTDMYINMYNYEGDYDSDLRKYAASDSNFLLKYAGLSFTMNLDNDVVKNTSIWYGLDNSDAARLYNTITAQAEFNYGFKATLGVGIRSVKNTPAGDSYNTDLLNPFGFAVGLSRQFKSLKKPTVYAQFAFNHDPFAIFGAGQDQLRMNRSNMTDICDGNGIGRMTAVNYYDGKAALRVGIRWDI